MPQSQLTAERLVPLREVRGLLAARMHGECPAASTVYSWCRHGVRDHRLEHIRLGGRLFTSAEAIDRFLAALNR